MISYIWEGVYKLEATTRLFYKQDRHIQDFGICREGNPGTSLTKPQRELSQQGCCKKK
jgi:hypothetical protein